MVKRVDNAVYVAIQEAFEGTFSGGVQELGLAEDGVGYALDQYNEDLITEEMAQKVEEARAAIIAGDIEVPSG